MFLRNLVHPTLPYSDYWKNISDCAKVRSALSSITQRNNQRESNYNIINNGRFIYSSWHKSSTHLEKLLTWCISYYIFFNWDNIAGEIEKFQVPEKKKLIVLTYCARTILCESHNSMHQCALWATYQAYGQWLSICVWLMPWDGNSIGRK